MSICRLIAKNRKGSIMKSIYIIPALQRMEAPSNLLIVKAQTGGFFPLNSTVIYMEDCLASICPECPEAWYVDDSRFESCFDDDPSPFKPLVGDEAIFGCEETGDVLYHVRAVDVQEGTMSCDPKSPFIITYYTDREFPSTCHVTHYINQQDCWEDVDVCGNDDPCGGI